MSKKVSLQRSIAAIIIAAVILSFTVVLAMQGNTDITWTLMVLGIIVVVAWIYAGNIAKTWTGKK
jgi:hypothetical protein